MVVSCGDVTPNDHHGAIAADHRPRSPLLVPITPGLTLVHGTSRLDSGLQIVTWCPAPSRVAVSRPAENTQRAVFVISQSHKQLSV